MTITGTDRDPAGVWLPLPCPARRVVPTWHSPRTISECHSTTRRLDRDQSTLRTRMASATTASLYAAMGSVRRSQRPHWRIAMLVNDRILEGRVGERFDEVWRTTNGGIPVRLVAS